MKKIIYFTFLLLSSCIVPGAPHNFTFKLDDDNEKIVLRTYPRPSDKFDVYYYINRPADSVFVINPFDNNLYKMKNGFDNEYFITFIKSGVCNDDKIIAIQYIKVYKYHNRFKEEKKMYLFDKK